MILEKKEKRQWLLSYIRDHNNVNILDSELHHQYIYTCKPNKIDYHALDFEIAPELGRYLSEMYKEGLLTRVKITRGYREAHTPSFVYYYSLSESK